ncbi:MAG TPA: hypothetical protein VNH22_09710 [Blastocatellia bacterium]|jgi:hypothetical protein|nr:hypothetical protein [Blastocatellia bacterium]
MKLNRLKTFFTLAVVTAMLCLQAEAQNPRAASEGVGKRAALLSAIKSRAGGAPKRTYEPVVLGNSRSFVIEGRVAAAGKGRIEIRTPQGALHRFDADDQTTYLQSGGLVSISTLPDVSLRLSDLRAADRVEIVAEREGQRSVARIVTRIAKARGQ